MSDTLLRVPGGLQSGDSQPPAPVSNEVGLTLGTKTWKGWKAVRIGRGAERFPSDFEVSLTERYPGQAGTLFAEPGSQCVLKIGADTVMTGRVDRTLIGIVPKGHELRIQGRSRCRDIVDSSAGYYPDGTWRSFFRGLKIIDIANQLGKPFNITASSQSADANLIAPDIFLNLGETPFEVLERICRWAGLLIMDDAAGNIVLANEGTTAMASGFAQGINVEAAQAQFTADQRYSDYVCLLMSTDAFFQTRAAVDGSTNGNVGFVIKDPSTPSQGFRPHIIIAEQPDQDLRFARRRITNEMNRRNGRSRQITVTTDSWRDSAGTLWTPNRLAPLNIPLLKVTGERFVIGEVTYRLDESGTHTDLTLMPLGSYSPEPLNLQPINRQVANALNGGAPTDRPSNRGIPAQGPGYDPSVQGRGDL